MNVKRILEIFQSLFVQCEQEPLLAILIECQQCVNTSFAIGGGQSLRIVVVIEVVDTIAVFVANVRD